MEWGTDKGRTIVSLGAISDDPGSILQTLFMTYTRLELDDISVFDLGTVKSKYGAVQLSTAVHSRENAMNVIDRLLAQCCFGRGLRDGRMGPIMFDLHAPTVGTLTNVDLLGRSPTFDATPPELVVNDIYCEYGDDGAGAVVGNFTVDFTNNRTCYRSYYDYGPSAQYTLQLPDCPDETTARWGVNRFLEFRAFRHDLVMLSVPHWVGFPVHQGDVYELTLAGGASIDGSGWANERCILLDRTFHLGVQMR